MRKPCSVLLLFVLLGLGVSLIVPAEDAPETACDQQDFSLFFLPHTCNRFEPRPEASLIRTGGGPERAFGSSARRHQQTN
jgi:hypothetical protein